MHVKFVRLNKMTVSYPESSKYMRDLIRDKLLVMIHFLVHVLVHGCALGYARKNLNADINRQSRRYKTL
jgi:hypothetical protein